MQKESIKEALETRAGRRKGTGKPYGFPMSFLHARSLRPSGAGEGWQFRTPACSLTVQYSSESIVPLYSKEHRIQEEPVIFIRPSIEISNHDPLQRRRPGRQCPEKMEECYNKHDIQMTCWV